MWPTTLPFVHDASTFALVFRLGSDCDPIMCRLCFEDVSMMFWRFVDYKLVVFWLCFHSYDQDYCNDLNGNFKHEQQILQHNKSDFSSGDFERQRCGELHLCMLSENLTRTCLKLTAAFWLYYNLCRCKPPNLIFCAGLKHFGRAQSCCERRNNLSRGEQFWDRRENM